MKKMTQRKAVFYMLYKAFKENPDQWVEIWRFGGELFIPERNEWFFMSYKTPTNGPTIFFDNPDLVEREYTTGKSGATFYQYRLKKGADRTKILDTDLREFYDSIRVSNLVKSNGTA